MALLTCLGAAGCAAGCISRLPPPPELTAIEPAQINADEPVTVTLVGKHFIPKVTINFDDPRDSRVVGEFTVTLAPEDGDAAAVAPLMASIVSDARLTVNLPALSAGLYALAVRDARGRTASLSAALVVTVSTCGDGVSCGTLGGAGLPASCSDAAAADADSDGSVAASCGGDDCDDTNASVHPGVALDDCNGVDNDCDGVADEDFSTQATGCGVGPCAAIGAAACAAGVVIDSCTPVTPLSSSDTTCDGIDDDCDGVADDDDPSCSACPLTMNGVLFASSPHPHAASAEFVDVQISAYDVDLAGHGTLLVDAVDNQDNETETVTLVESEPINNPGLFTGSLAVGAASAVSDDGTLGIAVGHRATLSYLDPAGADGNPVLIERAVDFVAAATLDADAFDLSTSTVSVTPAAASGATATFTVRIIVRNAGPAAVENPVSVDVHVGPNASNPANAASSGTCPDVEISPQGGLSVPTLAYRINANGNLPASTCAEIAFTMDVASATSCPVRFPILSIVSNPASSAQPSFFISGWLEMAP